jgi:hypothetical protein
VAVLIVATIAESTMTSIILLVGGTDLFVLYLQAFVSNLCRKQRKSKEEAINTFRRLKIRGTFTSPK